VHALREDRYKYIHFHGIWDLDELYDLASDPAESRNLLATPGHEALAQAMGERLFAELERTGGMQIPMRPDTLGRNLLRDPAGTPAAGFPPQFIAPRK
jgi:N-acetylglucosamine-6-sulfatase